MATDATQTEQDVFIERLLDAIAGTMDVYSIYLGDTFGLYRALAEGGPQTTDELAATTDTHERYVREWCEQQTVTGILVVDDPSASSERRLYSLPEPHVEVLTDEESLNFLAPLAQLVAGSAAPIGQVAEAFQTGGGVPYADYGHDTHEGVARTNRPSFLHLLGQEWLPAIPDVDASLRRVGARVADVGCGHGYSTIGMARAYPTITVDGFDLDAASVAAARDHVEAAGLEDRVTIHHGDAAGLEDRVTIHHGDAADLAVEDVGEYDLVTAFECVHDMSDPVGALRTMRRLAGDDGTVFVVDERAGDSLAEPSEIERLLYGFSVLHCLPVGMADQPSAATGTVMRADTLREYATEAGFEAVEILPIQNFFWRFYRLSSGDSPTSGGESP
ncbi:class I SAM-dependent methyltransferase [Haladaptatus sp. NG-WS-4]